MTYVLEDISKEDQQKIIDDASSDPNILGQFINGRFFTDARNNLKWAIDRDRHMYLFRSPNFLPEAGNEFHFSYNGVIYTIRVLNTVAPQKATSVWCRHIQVTPVPADIKAELSSAFAVYGLTGRGPKGSRGQYNSTFDVVPLFEGETS